MSEPYYWNRANFEGLAALVVAFRADARLVRLARYCELRERGLRKEALKELNAFIGDAGTWETPTRREVVLRILDCHWGTPQAHQFLAEPLRRRLVEPVLEQWRAAERTNAVPLRHLALLRGDRDLLDEALLLNAKDDGVRAAIARMLVRSVDFATHHLSEGKFIGEVSDSERALSEVAALLNGATDPRALAPIDQERRALAALLADWRQYLEAPEGTFPEWCRARNRTHGWWSIVYYEKGT